jgi:hypothetical protein
MSRRSPQAVTQEIRKYLAKPRGANPIQEVRCDLLALVLGHIEDLREAEATVDTERGGLKAHPDWSALQQSLTQARGLLREANADHIAIEEPKVAVETADQRALRTQQEAFASFGSVTPT